MKVTDGVDMNRTELRNAKLQELNQAPLGEESLVYYDGLKKRVGMHTGSEWRYLSTVEYEEVEFDFPNPDLVWTVVHNDASYPVPVVLDSVNRQVLADVTYPDENTLVITHSAIFSGKVKLKIKKK